jgi:calcium-dependent protein kinase
MEFCNGGDLLQHVIAKTFLYEEQAARIMYKLFSAVQHMHSKKIVHRDLKPENVLFESSAPDAEIKIIDFGLSRLLDEEALKDTSKLSFVGTPLYVAPEIVENVAYNLNSDCWSLGVLMYTLLSGKQPFSGSNLNSLYDNILNAQYDFFG